MKHLRFALGGTLVVLALLIVGVTTAFASQQACHAAGGADCDGWWVTLFGPGEGWVLDHTHGDLSGAWAPGQTHTHFDVTATWKRWVSDGHWDYADPICPVGYHVQNSGQWNQRCHRNQGTQGPEHKEPTGCPVGYNQSGADCRKWLDTSHWIYQSDHFTGVIQRPDCYQPCDETVAVFGEWSEWITDPEDSTQQSRTQIVTFVDARDLTTVCGSLELEEGQSLYCFEGSGLWVANGEEPPVGAEPGFCPPYYPCIEVVYGDTLEGIAIQMFGGPRAAYNGGLVVCESAVGDWGQNCVRSATIPAGGLLRGMFVCPAPSPDTGFALWYMGH